jgi:hypothetical protein
MVVALNDLGSRGVADVLVMPAWVNNRCTAK